MEGLVAAANRIRIAGDDVDPPAPLPAHRQPMPDEDAPCGDTNVVPLHARTVDDGEIRLGPVRVEPLTAAQEAQAVELLAALFAAAARRQDQARRRRRAA